MGRIPEEIIRQVIDRADIVDIISSYVPLKKSGRNFKALSPFRNEKTPSFVVSPEKQIFHCFSSGLGGNVVSFIMKMERMEFPEAVRFLAQKVGVVIPEENSAHSAADNIRNQIFAINEAAVQFYHEQLLTNKSHEAQSAREYLKKREISLETVRQFMLGFAPDKWDSLLNFLRQKDISFALMEKAGLVVARKSGEGFYDAFRNRIIFPILDTRAHCRAFGARTLEKDNPAKYINSSETPVYTKGHHLYGFHLARQAILDQNEVVVVEGYFDCIVPHQAGVRNVVASLGTALTIEQVRLLGRYTKNVVMLFDADAAGESAMLRSLDMLVAEGMNVRIARLTQGEDPDSYIRKFGADSFRKCLEEAQSVFEFKLNKLRQEYGDVNLEAKAKIVAEMVTTLAKFPNAVLREGYTEDLAKKLSIPVRAIHQEMQAALSKQETPRSVIVDSQPTENFQGSLRAVERNILKLVLSDNQYVAVTFEQVALDDFEDVRVRQIMAKIQELSRDQNELSVSALMSSLSDQSLQQIVSQLVAEEEPVRNDREKIYRDCMSRLKSDSLKRIRKQLLEQIRKAELSGNNVLLEELQNQFNQYIKL